MAASHNLPEPEFEPATWASLAESAAVAVLASILEIGVTVLVLGDTLEELVGLALHVLIAAALAAWLWLLQRRHAGLRLPILLTIATAALGPVGSLGTIVALLLYLIFRRNAASFEEWYEALFPESELLPASDLFEELQRGGDPTVSQRSLASFNDILAMGPAPQKQALIRLVSSNYRPAFAPILRTALASDDLTLRVQAASAVAQIENRFLKRAMELEAEAAAGGADAALALARHYDDYAFSGILDSEREGQYRRMALEKFKAALALAPDNPELLASAMRLMVRLGRHDEATASFEQFPQEKAAAPVAAIRWYIESLYRLGRFDRLREVIAQHRALLDQHGQESHGFGDAIALWSPEPAAVRP